MAVDAPKRKLRFTDEEDRALAALHAQLGKRARADDAREVVEGRWDEIPDLMRAQGFPPRTKAALKKRIQELHRPSDRWTAFGYSDAEDDLLLDFCARHAPHLEAAAAPVEARAPAAA